MTPLQVAVAEAALDHLLQVEISLAHECSGWPHDEIRERHARIVEIAEVLEIRAPGLPEIYALP